VVIESARTENGARADHCIGTYDGATDIPEMGDANVSAQQRINNLRSMTNDATVGDQRVGTNVCVWANSVAGADVNGPDD
jgi:hypothetical protein